MTRDQPSDRPPAAPPVGRPGPDRAFVSRHGAEARRPAGAIPGPVAVS
ncbi:hypothetical protein RM844_11480 [Streptomyces sp. DSM 44915]|uniref:Uncharacterized protein n=1 Tax=Streptomyces chisholmiae TaxID=3075540 RepID=A0ABU2JPJ3_9ACTN|nr:hypothetical protein [Streptomyces sp. DSM 44915]MDT0266912.1 hypothetical protein [Streptomyces sp. DSM 44915]